MPTCAVPLRRLLCKLGRQTRHAGHEGMYPCSIPAPVNTSENNTSPHRTFWKTKHLPLQVLFLNRERLAAKFRDLAALLGECLLNIFEFRLYDAKVQDPAMDVPCLLPRRVHHQSVPITLALCVLQLLPPVEQHMSDRVACGHAHCLGPLLRLCNFSTHRQLVTW